MSGGHTGIEGGGGQSCLEMNVGGGASSCLVRGSYRIEGGGGGR